MSAETINKVKDLIQKVNSNIADLKKDKTLESKTIIETGKKTGELKQATQAVKLLKMMTDMRISGMQEVLNQFIEIIVSPTRG